MSTDDKKSFILTLFPYSYSTFAVSNSSGLDHLRRRREGAIDLSTVPEIIDTVFANERFGLVFTKTRVYKFGHR